MQPIQLDNEDNKIIELASEVAKELNTSDKYPPHLNLLASILKTPEDLNEDGHTLRKSIRHGGSGNVRRLTATGHRQASCLCECLRYGDGSRIVGATIIYCGTALSPNKRNLPGFFPVS